MRSKEFAANRSAVTAGNPVFKEFFDLRGPLVALRGCQRRILKILNNPANTRRPADFSSEGLLRGYLNPLEDF
jgi:hypothetical protein